MEIFLILVAAAILGFVIYKATGRKLPVVDMTFPEPSAPYEPENIWVAPAYDPATVTAAPVITEVVAVEVAPIAAVEVAPVAPVAEAKPKAAPKAKKPAAPKAEKAPAKKAAAKKTSK